MAKKSRSIVEIRRSDVRWKNNKKIFKETKKQRRLFEFDIPTASSLNVREKSFDTVEGADQTPIIIGDDDDEVVEEKFRSETPGEPENSTEVIELLQDEEEEALEPAQGTPEELFEEKDSEKDLINCPMCGKDLTAWENYQRDAHAEKCLEESNGTRPATVTKRAIARPSLPQIKILEFTNNHKIVVDGFNFDRNTDITQYFLSHFHADHYMGLRKSWDHGTIYGSKITIDLMVQKFNMPRDLVRILPLNVETWFEPTISVIPLDANHCPGATVFLFQEWDPARTRIIKQILHTGDFRSDASLIARLNDICLAPIDQIYLDTTYLIPGFHFPQQQSVLKVAAEFCTQIVAKGKGKLFNDSQKSIFNFKLFVGPAAFLYKCLFLVGTYTIGKERLAIAIAQALHTKIYVPRNSPRFKIVSQYIEYFPPDMITHDLEQSCVHLVPLATLHSKDSIDQYFRPFAAVYEDVVGFIPTGWTYTNKYAASPDFADSAQRIAYCKATLDDAKTDHLDIQFILRQYKRHAKYQVFKVPYSEHSSFKDLVRFGTAVHHREMLATVNLHDVDKIREMHEWFRAWKAIATGQG